MLTLAALALCLLSNRPGPAGEETKSADLFDDFEQIIERGAIPAIDDPQFVGADEAEIPDDAWVLGVEIGGQPRAYSLNVLSRHEIVNDRAEENLFAAVW
jgi:hypothetical protein